MHRSRQFGRIAAVLAILWLPSRVFAVNDIDSAAFDSTVVVQVDSVSKANVNEPTVQETDQTPAPPLWMDFYTEGANEPNENNNPYGYLEVKVGKKINTSLPVDLYTKFRVEGDRDHYFWHNREDIGIGGRIHLLTEKASLFFLTEGMVGRFIPDRGVQTAFENVQAQLTRFESQLQGNYYELEQYAFRQSLGIGGGKGDSLQKHIDALSVSIQKLQNYIDSLQQVSDSIKAIPASLVTDIRAGPVFYKGWGNDPDGRIFPLRSWGDIYGDLIFLSSMRQIQERGADNLFHNSFNRYTNLIATFSPKIGFVLIEGLLGSLITYGEANCMVDVRGDWYNNLGWVAAGLRYKPFNVIDLSILAEYTTGCYWGRQYKDDVNPNKPTFANFRLGINFWYGVGL